MYQPIRGKLVYNNYLSMLQMSFQRLSDCIWFANAKLVGKREEVVSAWHDAGVCIKAV